MNKLTFRYWFVFKVLTVTFYSGIAVMSVTADVQCLVNIEQLYG